MTGFGSADADSPHSSFRVEIRSVNHRHLLVKSRLPGEFAHLEGEVEKLARKKVNRGALTVFVNVTRHPGAETTAIDDRAAAAYLRQWKKLQKSLGVDEPLTPAVLLGLPGVVAAQNGRDADRASEDRRVLKLVGQALDGLVAMRRTEGAALEADLRKHGKACGRIVARIDKRMPKVVRSHQDSLQRRIADLLDGRQGLDDQSLAREVALLADRLDVSEEVARLESHLDQLNAILDKGGAVGRKLDFLMQEIFREANTIGSKCSDSDVSHWVVEAKTTIERLREQVQNVE